MNIADNIKTDSYIEPESFAHGFVHVSNRIN